MVVDREELSILIGKRIKELRQSKKMSQEQLALVSGLNPAYLGRVERGEKCASVETIFKIAKGLSISPSEIIEFDASLSQTKEKALCRIEHIFSNITDEMALDIADIVERIAKLGEQQQ